MDMLWCCPGQLSKSHKAEKYRIEGHQEYDNFDNRSNCHRHVQVVYPTSPKLASEKKDARSHIQDKHGCKKHIAGRKQPCPGRRREWQGIGRGIGRLKWAPWLGALKLFETANQLSLSDENDESYLAALLCTSSDVEVKMYQNVVFGLGKQSLKYLKWTRRVANPQFHGDAGGWAYSWWARWPPHQNSHRPA